MALDQGAVATLISLRLRDGAADIRGHQTGLALASIVTPPIYRDRAVGSN